MLMYIISMLTRPYSVACGSEEACVHVCLCVCVCERLFLLSRRKEGSKCLVVNIAFYFHLYYLFTVQHYVKIEQTLELAANSINVTYIVIYINIFMYIYIYNK